MQFGKWKVEAVNGVRVTSGGLGSQSVMEVYHMRFAAAGLGLFKTFCGIRTSSATAKGNAPSYIPLWAGI